MNEPHGNVELLQVLSRWSPHSRINFLIDDVATLAGGLQPREPQVDPMIPHVTQPDDFQLDFGNYSTLKKRQNRGPDERDVEEH